MATALFSHPAKKAALEALLQEKRLQAEARENGGGGWIRDVVKVHVSVTHIADLSFRTNKLVQFLPFAPDSLMLDHRKLDEVEPYRSILLAWRGNSEEPGWPSRV